MASMQGVIKRLISDKGFGFVQASDGNEYFFHQSAVVDGARQSHARVVTSSTRNLRNVRNALCLAYRPTVTGFHIH